MSRDYSYLPTPIHVAAPGRGSWSLTYCDNTCVAVWANKVIWKWELEVRRSVP